MFLKQIAYFDSRLSRRLVLPFNSTLWRVARLVAHTGDGPYIFGALGLLGLMGLLNHNWSLCWAILFIASTVSAAIIVVTLIKFAIRRERPGLPGEFVVFRYDAYSFPSGHAARMAALAIGLAVYSSRLGWLLAGLALAVGLARISVGVHYVSDVVVGFTIGVLVAWGLMLLLPFLPMLLS